MAIFNHSYSASNLPPISSGLHYTPLRSLFLQLCINLHIVLTDLTLNFRLNEDKHSFKTDTLHSNITLHDLEHDPIPDFANS